MVKKSILKSIKKIKRLRVRKRQKRIKDTVLKIDEEELKKFENKNIEVLDQVESEEDVIYDLIKFDMKLTDFELKLKYLNLKDINGKEYGSFFPPYQSKLILIDNEGRKYSVIRAGSNQISGDLTSFFNINSLEQGDIIQVEYNRNEISNNGKHVLRLKTDNKKNNKKNSSNITTIKLNNLLKESKLKEENRKEDDFKQIKYVKEFNEKKIDNIIKFEHRLSSFECQLKYINLMDINGKEYGNILPPYRSRFIIVDEDGNEFTAIKAGSNQISGDLSTFFLENDLKPGDIITIEYNDLEVSADGSYILKLKLKK